MEWPLFYSRARPVLRRRGRVSNYRIGHGTLVLQHPTEDVSVAAPQSWPRVAWQWGWCILAGDRHVRYDECLAIGMNRRERGVADSYNKCSLLFQPNTI